MQHSLHTPLTQADLAPLRAGDTVLLSGVVYTARDAAHARMMELLDAGQALPFPIEGAAIYYVGPTPERPGCAIGAAGPTTSGRMDAYTPRLLDLGLACMIGKGKRSAAVKASVVQNGAVYLAAIGGAGALLRSHRLAGPWVRGGAPSCGQGFPADGAAGRPRRRFVRERPRRLPGQPGALTNPAKLATLTCVVRPWRNWQTRWF